MSTYNPNDFRPSSGAKIDSQGNVRNTADGYNADGSENVVLEGGKIIPPTLIDTIPYTTFTASTIYWNAYSNKLSRNATRRVFYVKNGLNQALSQVSFSIQDSAVYVGGSKVGDTLSASGLPAAGQTGIYSSDVNKALEIMGDSFQIGLGMGSTAPTSGNVQIYVAEVLAG